MLKDCRAGERFEGVVLVNEWKEVPFRQKPGSFLALICQDSSGVIQGKMWNYDPKVLDWLEKQDIFRIKGMANEYRGLLGLTLETIRIIPQESVDLSDLLPCSPVSVQELEERLQRLVGKITRPELRELLEQLLSHPEIGTAYRQAPAAMKVHQAYLRGLWEHSVRVAEVAEGIAGNYPGMDSSLVITGALLHDLGKILEYSYERGIKVTTEGRLLGHIILGIELLSGEIDKLPNFSQELRAKLLHIITSHHGKYEWQSPKRPKSMEALAVHYADVLDAELFHFEQAIEKQPGDEWSAYVPSLERYLYLK